MSVLEKRKCIKCKKKKPLEIGNFRRMKNFQGHKSDFEEICRQCYMLDYQRNYIAQKFKEQGPVLKECAYRECTNMANRSKKKHYCCDEHKHIEQQLKRVEKLQHNRECDGSKEIPQRFLVRGRISGVHY